MYSFKDIDIPYSAITAEVEASNKELSHWVTQGKIDESSSTIQKLELKLKRKLLS
jgi:hypothetical protein